MSRPGSPSRRAGAAAACLAVAAGLAATAVLARSAPARVQAACATSGLVVWLDTQGNGAAGSIYYHLELTNLSGRTCTIRGYPGVSAVDLGGRQIGSAASRNPQHAPRTVTLGPGATATAVLQVAQVDNFPASVCRRTTAAALRVYPPNQTAARIVPFPFGACSRTGPTYLTVQAVQKP